MARTGQLDLTLTLATAAAAVITGDALGHTTGRLLGTPTAAALVI
ncbi:hypothetical protein ACWGIN_27445 [Streptomyces sp. NPDC054861]